MMVTRSPARDMAALSLAGSEVPFYLLDGSTITLRVTPTTSAGAAVLAIAEAVGLRDSSCYSIFELSVEEEFRACQDSTLLSKVMAKWEKNSRCACRAPSRPSFRTHTHTRARTRARTRTHTGRWGSSTRCSTATPRARSSTSRTARTAAAVRMPIGLSILPVYLSTCPPMYASICIDMCTKRYLRI